jgi:hypothetical protein
MLGILLALIEYKTNWLTLMHATTSNSAIFALVSTTLN